MDADTVLALGKLVLEFAEVERAVYRLDGRTHETDTDHTVMLGVLGCSVAARLYPELDLGKVAHYALVHDLVEVYAGDTPTFNISSDAREEKAAREREAQERIEREFNASFPWLIETLSAYEALADSEARFIKTLDKCMPKITHILNRGVYFRENNKMREELTAAFQTQHEELSAGYGKEFPAVMHLVRVLQDMTIEATFSD